MGVGDEEGAILHDHHRQGTVGAQITVRQNLADIVEMPAILAKGAADQAVGLAAMDHYRADGGGVGPHDRTGEVGGNTPPGHDFVIGAPVVAIARVVLGIDYFEIPPGLDSQSGTFGTRLDHLGAADQDGLFGGIFQNRLRRAHDPLVLTLGKDDPARCGTRRLEHGPHEQGRFEHRSIKAGLVFINVFDRSRGHARLHRRPRHRR